MVARRELARAEGFERRRLCAALVVGPPEDSGAEPPRPGRALLGGGVLAVLLLLAHVAVPMALGREDPDWARPGLLVVEESGALHVVLDEQQDPPVVHAVPNVASALLLLDGPAEPRPVSAETLTTATRGPDLGLPGAPSPLPEPARLVPGGWSACTAPPGPGAEGEDGGPGGIVLALAADPAAAPAPGAAVAVRHGEDRYLLADDGDGLRRHLLPDPGSTEPLLAELGLPSWAEVPAVPARWLALVPEGDRLDPAALAAGEDAEDADAPPGDLAEPCLLMVTAPGERPHVALARDPAPAASAAGLAPDALTVRVEPGAGAHVRLPGAGRGTSYLVDGRGRVHRLAGDRVPALLGYADGPVLVPAAWLALLTPGEVLSPEAARRGPEREGAPDADVEGSWWRRIGDSNP